jgi:hypothetical protein
MTRTFGLILVGITGLLYAGLGEAGSVKGPVAFGAKIGPKGTLILSKANAGDLTKFKGGRRACVIVKGDHNPIVPVTVEILDEKDNVVARDDPAAGATSPGAKGNDLAAVIWYPPRDGHYRIRIHNHGVEIYNDCYIVIQ